VVTLRDIDTARIWVEAGENRVIEGGVLAMPPGCRHTGREAQEEGGEIHGAG
jgi:hypothetical protein